MLSRDEGFALAPSALRTEVIGRGLGAVLISNPCNPTGHLVRGLELQGWVEMARECGCWLIMDEFYSHYLYDAPDGAASHSAAAQVENVDEDPVMLLDGLTKNWRYPGWRLSWTLGPKRVVERIGSAGSFLDGGPPHPLQRAALPLLERSHADAEARAIQATFSEKRRLTLEKLEGMGMSVRRAPAGAFYVFAGLDGLPEPLRDGMSLFEAALDQKVIVVPGEFFDVNPGKRRSHIPSRLKGYVRVSFGPDLRTVEAGLERLAGVIAAHR